MTAAKPYPIYVPRHAVPVRTVGAARERHIAELHRRDAEQAARIEAAVAAADRVYYRLLTIEFERVA